MWKVQLSNYRLFGNLIEMILRKTVMGMKFFQIQENRIIGMKHISMIPRR